MEKRRIIKLQSLKVQYYIKNTKNCYSATAANSPNIQRMSPTAVRSELSATVTIAACKDIISNWCLTSKTWRQ